MLPRIAVERPSRVIGKSTTEAMQSGIFWGYVGLVEGMVQRITSEFGADLAVVATGGLAPLFVGVTTTIHHLDPDITMGGRVGGGRRGRAGAAGPPPAAAAGRRPGGGGAGRGAGR